jgi:hypothetical protein
LRTKPTQHELEAIRRETEELVYYIRQRIGIRFGEFYQMSFNPAALRADMHNLTQELQDAWKELVRIVSYDVSQEMLATTLRLEKKLRSMLRGYRDRRVHEIRDELEDFESVERLDNGVNTPDVDEQLEVAPPEGRWLMQQFKNPKTFFEGGGSKKLKDQLETRVLESVSQYGEQHIARLVAHYEEAYTVWVEEANAQLKESVDEYVHGGLSAYEREVDLGDLQRRLEELKVIKYRS